MFHDEPGDPAVLVVAMGAADEEVSAATGGVGYRPESLYPGLDALNWSRKRRQECRRGRLESLHEDLYLSGLRPVCHLQVLDPGERPIIGHQDGSHCKRVSADHHIQIAHRLPIAFERGAKP